MAGQPAAGSSLRPHNCGVRRLRGVWLSGTRRWLGFGLAVGLPLALPALVSAHGIAPDPPSNPFGLLAQWSFDPLIQVPLIATAVGYLSAVRRVNAAHPANPVPRRRSVAFLLGIAALEIALQSPIERYDTTSVSVHR